MKTLNATDTDLLVKAWRSVLQSNKRTPMDYACRLYYTFTRFALLRGMRLISADVVKDERAMLDKDLALIYIGALRTVLDPKGVENEADVVLQMISATNEQRQSAINIMRRQGIKF